MVQSKAVTGPSDAPTSPQIRRAAIAALLGSTAEWYDFYLYSSAAALVFSHVFFSGLGDSGGILAAFGTYAVGFGARPLGALIAGALGDRMGRRSTLIGSLLLMALSSALIGVLPGDRQIGTLAPVLLIVLRILQGLSVGGQQGGAVVLVAETAGPGRRGLWTGVSNAGSSAGLLLATGAFALIDLASHHFLMTWGWRLLFLANVLVGGVGFLVRLGLQESPVFLQARERDELAKQPVRDVLTGHRRDLLIGVGLRISQTAVSYFYTAFVLFYEGHVDGGNEQAALTAVTVSAGISMVTTPFWGGLSDRFGRRRLFLFGAIGSLLYMGPFFLLAETGSPLVIVLAVIVGVNLFHDAMYGPQSAWLGEQFRTSVRYSGAALSYQVGALLGGGMLPLVATWLYYLQSGSPWLIWAYFAVLSALTVWAAARAPETSGPAIVDGAGIETAAATAPSPGTKP